MIVSNNFEFTMEGKKNDIISTLNTVDKAIIEEKKRKLVPVIKTIIFCRVQNIPLREHRDDGSLAESSNASTTEEVEDLTGGGLCKVVLVELQNPCLDISNCRGQAFDGGSNTSGKYQGLQARIAKIQPLAIYSHCANHRLNLVISKASSTPSIRNAVGGISSVAIFFENLLRGCTN
ncbi:hypothetical protein JTE90_003383 [Oedothorax gibbosus]|uniref:DUF4371 domain-containing protein n=1 Tax=Oedothorax gibbosus TaxID=931172 RepID=A0AAV6TXL5_9ARAC|nr:hypothetical protein JTE90_003383 [Oedothorax gibbosus]